MESKIYRNFLTTSLINLPTTAVGKFKSSGFSAIFNLSYFIVYKKNEIMIITNISKIIFFGYDNI